MANIKSAKKRARQSEKKRIKNLNRKTAIKTAVKKVLVALEQGEEKEKALALLKEAEALFARAKCKKVVHKRTASRKISRLSKRVAAAYK